VATVLIHFDTPGVPIVTGELPTDPQTPIQNPVATGFVTNQAFIVPAGTYCYGLQTDAAVTPLWQVVQAVDGEQTEASFRRRPA